MRPLGRCASRIGLNGACVVLLALLFFGAMFWAKGRDPFQRVWFKVKARGWGKAECVAVLPKMAQKGDVQRPLEGRPGGRARLPVVIYLHGSGGSLLRSGNEIRQMAEMGLAVVGMEYWQKDTQVPSTNAPPRADRSDSGARAGVPNPEPRREVTRFEAEFTALLDHVNRQKWADTNRIAWVGFSLGAQQMLKFALKHPGRHPNLLVRVAGGWVFEQPLPSSGIRTSDLSVLIVHGEADDVFPVSEAERVAHCLLSNGAPVEFKVLAGQGHAFGPNRLLLFRAIGEYCLKHLKGDTALESYRSILSWQAQAKPLSLYWIPAGAWAVFWLCARRRCRTLSSSEPSPSHRSKLSHSSPSGRSQALEAPSPSHPGGNRPAPQLARWEIGLRWTAAVLATAAVGQTALHLVPPRLAVSHRTLAVAREHLVQEKERRDFDFLAADPCWSGKGLRVLLQHVELANYNRELINWKLDEALYREYVLSPKIAPTADGNLNWRRPLWENFYPRIRKENSAEAAAEIVARFLRERVTIAGGEGFPETITRIWERQITQPSGFEAVYVAALRSCGVPARLGAQRQAEFWTESGWTPAPRPLVGAWEHPSDEQSSRSLSQP